MSVITGDTGTQISVKPLPVDHSQRMPFILQVIMLTWRTLVINFRVPAAVLPPIIISAFFLLVYEASLGGAANFLPGLSGKSYLGFILPLSVVSAALSGAGVAGQSIVRDIENGYFDKLSLTPVSRGALIFSPIVAGAIILCIQTLVVVTVAVLMGLEPVTGLPGLIALIGFALLLGIGFAGFSVGVALYSGNAAATQSSSFLFFPLTFLTATFVPIELLDGWIRTAAEWNPITYILDAMRSLMLDGWVTDTLLIGIAASVILGVIFFVFAFFGMRRRTAKK